MSTLFICNKDTQETRAILMFQRKTWSQRKSGSGYLRFTEGILRLAIQATSVKRYHVKRAVGKERKEYCLPLWAHTVWGSMRFIVASWSTHSLFVVLSNDTGVPAEENSSFILKLHS